MKQYYSLINKSIPFGKGLNALAHSAIGIGHWIPNGKMPNITILFTDEKTIREFRQEAQKLLLTHPSDVIYSDFTNTMTVGATDNCAKITKETHESELVYFAASLCSEGVLTKTKSFSEIINRCNTLKNYHPYIAKNNENEFRFKGLIDLPDYQSLPTNKLSLTLDRTRSPAALVNATVISSLCIGMQADLEQLKLVIYVDADNQKHPYISYHPFPVLAARQQNKFNDLAKNIESDQQLLKKIVKDQDGNTISACILGAESQVNAHTRQKFISLWTAELTEADWNS